MNIGALLEKADTLGWSVYEDEYGWEFGQPSPAGEDFSFYVNKDGVGNAASLAHEIRQYANNFDIEEHVAMWLDGKCAGTQGVPDIKTLVEDADDIKEMIDELASQFESLVDDEQQITCEKDAFEWLSRKLDLDGAFMAIVENVLEYADGLSGDEQYDFLLKMLDGVICLTEDEICSLCWN